MFDTHTHVNLSPLFENAKRVIKDAHTSGVTNLLVPGTDLESSKRAVELSNTYPNVYCAVGIHPENNLKIKSQKSNLKQIENLISNSRVVAIGEIGLDKHYSQNSLILKQQADLFLVQLSLAVQSNKSVIIHSRESSDEMIELLTIYWSLSLSERLVFHCCEADSKLLDFALSHNSFIGVDGDVTYSQKKADFIKTVPLKRLVVETDSPFLTPLPVRLVTKFPNTPANLPHIVSYVAKLHGKSKKYVADTTTENAKKLFNVRI